MPSMTILKDALKNKTRLKQFPSLLDGKSYYLHNRSGKHKVNNSKTFKPENSKMAFQASQLSLLLWGCIYYKNRVPSNQSISSIHTIIEKRVHLPGYSYVNIDRCILSIKFEAALSSFPGFL